MKILYKGKEIEPFESFYHNTSPEFFRGQLGGGAVDVANAMMLLP